ncbi:hypothetical protein ACHAXA_002287 [Cyclostephanos tholiformis]|uniref:PPM-type phosphatase domain-containing protein n=1 Tax=Cyclostephanos tholiformis TaxID=382380 RepID=A0ABD3RD99_9STRA
MMGARTKIRSMMLADANPQTMQQKHVADLRRLIILQNRAIIALSFLFAALLLSTLVLINTATTTTSSSLLPGIIAHTNDDRRPFWERAVERDGGDDGSMTRSLFGPEGKLRKRDRASSSTGVGKANDKQQQRRQQQQQQQQPQQQPQAQRGGKRGGGVGRPLLGTRTITKKKPINTTLEVSKCRYMYFGCPLFPMELTRLNISDSKSNYYYPSHASSGHIMLTHMSNRVSPARVNQDRVVLMPAYVYSPYTRSREDIIQSLNDPRDDFFAGVFDGHGDNGHHVSQFVSEQIPSRIASGMVKSGYEDDKSKSIDGGSIVGVFREVEGALKIRDGGSTANIALRVGNRLYLANTGDSTAFICTYQPPDYYDRQLTAYNKAYVMKKRDGRTDINGDEEQQLYLQGSITVHHRNVRHKPHLPLERSRIEMLGGRVHVPQLHPEQSRVIVHEDAGAHRGDDVGLAMSRSIGDKEWTTVGVIPDPDVAVVDLQEFFSENDVNGARNGAEKRVFVVLGSDGLFDVRKAEYVASHLAYGLFEWGQGWGQRQEDKDNEELQQVFSNHLLEVGKKLVDMASPLKRGAYRDDISFIAKTIELQD